jgi:response regulator of citrate/malate metabolism
VSTTAESVAERRAAHAEPRWTVLVVEDSSSVAGLHRRLVDATPGFHALGVATDGESAYEAVVKLRPHLAIVDLAMPGGDGITFLRRVRSEGLPLEVIVVTASRDAPTIRETLHFGVVDYLVKPFAPERLQHSLAAFAQRARALCRAQLAQEEVDLVQVSGAFRMHRLPKGLKRSTLKAVRDVLAASAEPLSAQEVGARIGVARVTARRYLEYLEVIGAARMERESCGPGRPRNRYGHVPQP